jgi:hypothetical protein
MPINVAMPVAHEAAAPTYGAYYSGGACVFRIAQWFNRAGCDGIRLERDPAAPLVLADRLWDLFAINDGFLSMRGNSVVLRLPRELNAAAVSAFNSGRQFLRLVPDGPQLRHVVYAFLAAPGAAVQNRIRAIVNDAAHPGRNITRLPNPAGGTYTLAAHLAANPGDVNRLVQDFMNGAISLFVRAGDIIGNFGNVSVTISFVDSCGTLTPAPGNPPVAPVVPGGRPLNPSYFLFLVRAPGNAAEVNMLTEFAAAPAALADTHPLDHLLAPAAVATAGGNAEQALDVAAAHPPKPLHVTIDVRNAAGVVIAARGISIANAGDWHESRNATNPFNTNAPVRWRYFGNLPGDVAAADFATFRTQVKPGQVPQLPGGAAFNHEHAPTQANTDRVRAYWSRYAAIFNAVAEAFEVPCDLQVALACKETGPPWFDAVFANSHEMDVIRMEPLNAAPATITANAADQALLTQYRDIAGGVGGAHNLGANAEIPVPWNGGGLVAAPVALTWDQLAGLIADFPRRVRVSPGVMQTLVKTAHDDTDWVADVYGTGYVDNIGIVHNGVALSADDPPAGLDDLFSEWFGVAVDAAGVNTVVAANVDQTLTKMKRALHSLIAGGAHIKRTYNHVIGNVNKRNRITDFDLPTVGSGYNDAAAAVAAAAAADNDARKWERLFALRFFNQAYPRDVPRFFNAAVTLFNALPAGQTQPELRLWRP